METVLFAFSNQPFLRGRVHLGSGCLEVLRLSGLLPDYFQILTAFPSTTHLSTEMYSCPW